MTSGWDGILEPGERIIWQGRPDYKFDLKRVPVIIYIAGFSMVTVMSYQLIANAMFQTTAGIVLSGICILSGLLILIGIPFLDAHNRKYTTYTLTDRRAFIAAITILGDRLWTSHQIRIDFPITFKEGSPPSIYFTEGWGHRWYSKYRVKVPVGFERINNAHEVHALLQKVQRREA
ncbi:hypothetical protein [Parasulfitobacter algicola]|uniref:PH domain-containing protein n=1 Tax=Parasulfitobacter algicola TaxID=2614809 RepID=A0ABX2IUD5_9RHOB|nr:hypothetical protein [Sulfitobacter algicola]NSX56491.1 hypothetical protein [Sulfitobacter algicola]